MGNITFWNDDAILKLNPSIALKLPNVKIKLGYYSRSSFGMLYVLTEALSSLCPEFEEAFAAAGHNITNLRPTLEGNGFGFSSEFEKAQWVKVLRTVYAYVYV